APSRSGDHVIARTRCAFFRRAGERALKAKRPSVHGARGCARRAPSVELRELLRVDSETAADASAQRIFERLDVPATCREFNDAFDAFRPYLSHLGNACRDLDGAVAYGGCLSKRLSRCKQ